MSVSYPIELSTVMENHASIYEDSLKNPEQFWGDLARRRLRWMKDFDQVMQCNMSTGQFSWFLGGRINVTGGRSPALCYLLIGVDDVQP